MADDGGCGTKEPYDDDSDACLVPPTEMLYMTYEGNGLTECTARVLQVSRGVDNTHVVVCLDRTVFHAQGGGQPTDQGTLICDKEGAVSTLHVSKVVQDRDTGVASHMGQFGTSATMLQVGDTVQVSIDKELRRVLSECHTGMPFFICVVVFVILMGDECPHINHSIHTFIPVGSWIAPLRSCVLLLLLYVAGHVVDSAMARCGKFLKPLKAYHFLEGPYVEYQGTLAPEEKETLPLDLQLAFCQLVNEQIDSKIDLLSKGEADALCNRQAQNFDMDMLADKRTNQIRVVTVAGYPCPCGGTHVLNTGDLKERQWGITGIKSKKGVVRVKYGQNVLS
jgi:Ser-tRNA(Ala) deacylase AlaX